jgi:RNA polymerase sigma factor (sigma-70 family)
MTEPTDAELVRRSLAEPHVFEELFERHFGRVFAFLRRQAGPELAEELCAETFARAFDGRARYDRGRPDAAPWLFGIATNLLRERRRRALRVPAFERAAVEEQSDDRSLELAAALRELSPLERETLLLYAWADLSYEEIGKALGIPLGTVRSRLSRAREHMRARLASAAKEVACDG